MNQDQIKVFVQKMAEVKHLEINAKQIQQEARDLEDKAKASCDHKNPDGKIAGHEFEGSYCGFFCSICGCSVSYERMGY